jgi:hypothetical protein
MSEVYQLVTSLHDAGGNFFQNVFHYTLDELLAFTRFEYARKLIDQWIAAQEGDYLAAFGNDVLLDFVSAKCVTGTGGPSASVIRGAGGAGGAISVSSGLAIDVQWQHGGASNRPGHTFLASFPEGAVEGGSPQALYIASLAPWLLDMVAPLTLTGGAGTAQFGTFRRATGIANDNTVGIVRPKVTPMNKRTLPVI